MERKEIIELAKKNGMTEFVPVGKNALWEQIEVWVTMAVEAEREACLKICEAQASTNYWEGADVCAEAIRARGQT